MLQKLRKKFSSLFTIYFASHCFISSIIILFSILTFFKATKQSEEIIFKSAIIQSEENILTQVQLYNKGLKKLYQSHDLSLLKKALAKLEELGTDFEKMDLREINRIGRSEDFSISLLDAKSTVVIATSESMKSYLNMNISKEFSTAGPLLAALKPGKINVRYSWNRARGRLRVFLRKLTKNKRYIWIVRHDFNKESPLDRAVKYLRSVQDHNPFVEKIGVYTQNYLTNHGLKKLPLPNNLNKAVLNKVCKSTFSCELWHQIKTPKVFGKNTQFIKYVGIKHKSKLQEESFSLISANLYKVILVSLSFSFIISFLLSHLLVKAIYRIINVTNKVSGDFNLKTRVPRLWNNELNALGSSFNNLLKSLSLKEKENQELSNDILATADKERTRISSDLHDSVGQLIVAANLKVNAGDTKSAADILQLACEELRNIYHRLDPSLLKELSFQEAVEWYLLKFFPKNYSYTLDLKSAEKFSHFIKVQLYRIMQEVIANAKKHSPQGRFLKISIKENSSKIIVIAENEVFHQIHLDQAKKSGLKNIELRVKSLGGKISIENTMSSFKICIELKIFNEYYKEK